METQEATPCAYGDLIKHAKYGQCLVVRDFTNQQGLRLMVFLGEDGTVSCSTGIDEWNVSHYTGLTYDWVDSRQLKKDFKAGLFAKYFE